MLTPLSLLTFIDVSPNTLHVSIQGKTSRTRTEILDAAWDLVTQKGAGVSMSEIARSVGLSRQAVYLHFGTRGGLLMALVKRADDRFDIKSDFFKAMEHRNSAERLDECLRVWFRFVRKIIPVARDLVRLRATDTDASMAWEDRMSDLRAWIRELVASLHRDNALAGEWSIDQAVDCIWTFSSVQVWDMFVTERGWQDSHAEETLRATIAKLILR